MRLLYDNKKIIDFLVLDFQRPLEINIHNNKIYKIKQKKNKNKKNLTILIQPIVSKEFNF